MVVIEIMQCVWTRILEICIYLFICSASLTLLFCVLASAAAGYSVGFSLLQLVELIKVVVAVLLTVCSCSPWQLLLASLVANARCSTLTSAVDCAVCFDCKSSCFFNRRSPLLCSAPAGGFTFSQYAQYTTATRTCC